MQQPDEFGGCFRCSRYHLENYGGTRRNL